jgi:hypothetical protein
MLQGAGTGKEKARVEGAPDVKDTARLEGAVWKWKRLKERKQQRRKQEGELYAE